jgi:hypothetical protein
VGRPADEARELTEQLTRLYTNETNEAQPKDVADTIKQQVDPLLK